MSQPLPQLLDVRGLMNELGVKRGVAESIMQKLPKFKEGRRVFVRRADVDRYISDNTVDAAGFRRTA